MSSPAPPAPREEEEEEKELPFPPAPTTFSPAERAAALAMASELRTRYHAGNRELPEHFRTVEAFNAHFAVELTAERWAFLPTWAVMLHAHNRDLDVHQQHMHQALTVVAVLARSATSAQEREARICVHLEPMRVCGQWKEHALFLLHLRPRMPCSLRDLLSTSTKLWVEDPTQADDARVEVGMAWKRLFRKGGGSHHHQTDDAREMGAIVGDFGFEMTRLFPTFPAWPTHPEAGYVAALLAAVKPSNTRIAVLLDIFLTRVPYADTLPTGEAFAQWYLPLFKMATALIEEEDKRACELGQVVKTWLNHMDALVPKSLLAFLCDTFSVHAHYFKVLARMRFDKAAYKQKRLAVGTSSS